MTRAIAFLSGTRPPDYGARLSRLRWMRAAGTASVRDGKLSDAAATLLSGAESWVLVRDPASLPVGRVPASREEETLVSAGAVPAEGAAHTHRELEQALLAPPRNGPPAALAFGARAVAAGPEGETVEELIRRLLARAGPGRFPVYEFADPSDRERPEVTARLPGGRLRVLDAGCGAGGLGLARSRNPGWEVTGIEIEPVLVARARERCDRVLEGDLTRVLPGLAARGERFDAVVFADVLEHLEDPWSALGDARALAAPGGILVASVPNVGHLSVVRDLLLGRCDGVPAGLCDSGHLRWFTRASLEEALEEAGWSVTSIEPISGAPAREPEAFLALARGGWPDADLESLGTYQWLAVASAS